MNFIGWISLLGLWYLFFWLYRDYRLDLFRHKLFSLRDDLFRMALEERIDFNSNAYGMLRSSINGTIRFGHRLGFLDLLCFTFFTRGDKWQSSAVKCYKEKWEKALSELKPEIRKEIENIQFRLHLKVVEQIIFTSAVLMFTMITFLCWLILNWMGKTVSKCIDPLFQNKKVRNYFDFHDCAATLSS